MRFTQRKPRQAPTVIIVSLIDILVVLLIFLMLTTTFKQQPAIKLALPESNQPHAGASEAGLVVTVAKVAPYFYFGPQPVTLDRLRGELALRAKRDPQATLTIRGDTDAALGKVINVMDTAKAAGITHVSVFTKPGVKP